VILCILAVLLLISCFAGLMLGTLALGPSAVLGALLGGGSSSALYEDIVWNLRLPRVILSAAVGMGLALSGTLMQAMFRNPMASPYIMGISSGAGLGAVCAIFFGFGAALGAGSVGAGAFCGALALSFVLSLMAGKRGGDTAYLLILGVALSAVSAGVTSIIIFSGANSTGMDVTLYWMMGSVAFVKLGASLFLLALVLCLSLFFGMQSKVLNLMMEGQEAAVPLGMNLIPFYRLYLVLNAVLVGGIVMEAGLIGFVGLIIPHFARIVMGASHRRLLPVAVLSGGILTVWADILGRSLIPGQDIPIGVTLAFIGAPLFIYMLLRENYHFGGNS
jgi:iron complex transport system permease protein